MNYKFDAERWLGVRAKAEKLRHNFADEEMFKMCLERFRELDAENIRLKKIVEAPWLCDVCGNYIGNEAACVEEK